MTRVEWGLWAVTGVCAACAVVGWFTGAPRLVAFTHAEMPNMADAASVPAESVDAAARIVTATDPFRLDRRPTSVPYQPDLEGVVPPPKPPKPQLMVEGLVGGMALVDGVPGHATTAIVQVGDTLGGLTIRRIGRDTVIVSSADTTWRLTLRRPWQ
jgi:hypothetical protein